MSALLTPVGQFLLETWWFWAYLALFPLFKSTWLHWRQETFKNSGEFQCIILELLIPREVKKTPQGMEQVLMAIHGLRNAPGDLAEKWKDGEVTRWFSLEMVSFGGETHFYIRTYYKYRPLLEAAFYSYYPDVELVEVDDYTSRLPQNITEMYEQGYDLWGTEMLLGREAAYPIKTYDLFLDSIDETKLYDPISAFLEVLAKVKSQEIVGIQILISPADPKWRDTFAGLLEKIRETKGKPKGKAAKSVADFPGGPLPAFETKVSEGGADAVEGLRRAFTRTPGETEVLKAVEDNLTKQAFDTLIRFIYLSPKTIFYDSFARRGLTGSFNQYAALDLNSFRQNWPVSTRTRFWHWPHILPNVRNEYKKQRLLWNYRKRMLPPETFMGRLLTTNFLNWNFPSRTFLMTTKCLASLYHPPMYIVLTGPHIKRMESRKAGPPAGLAIFGEEREVEKFR